MKLGDRQKDLILCVFGFLLGTVSFCTYRKISFLSEIHHKSGVYAGCLFFLIYCIRLRIAAEGRDPESNEAFREYIKVGSLYLFTMFVFELPVMLAAL
jgi:hypothetical protein